MYMQKYLTALLVLLATTANAQTTNHVDRQAQALINAHRLIYVDGEDVDSLTRVHDLDSMRLVVGKFYYDQFRHTQEPAAPTFLFMSKKANLSLGIGGGVRMRAYYDWHGSPNAAGFSPILLPMTPDPTSRKSFNTTPSGTYLFFRLIGSNDIIGEYQLYIEADFTGYQGRDFKLKKAYAMVRDFTVGYAASTFSDPQAEPSMVDAAGPNNKISSTSVLVRYMPHITKRWSVAVSAETPSAAASIDGVNTASVRDYIPDFAAFVQYQPSRGEHIRLSGIVRTLPYRNMLMQRNHSVVGWGLQLSGVTHITDRLTGMLNVNYGHGHGSLSGDLKTGDYDLLPVSESSGSMYAPASWGWCGALQYNFRPNLFVSLIGSQTRLNPAHPMSPDSYKTGLLGAANVFWNITPRLLVGAEMNVGHRRNVSGASHTSYRAGAMCMFSF